MAQAIPIVLTVASTAVGVMGSLQAASAAEQQAQMQKNIYDMQAKHALQVAEYNAKVLRDKADYDAAMLRREGNEAAAEKQREALDRRRQADLTVSRALAVAASSGGSAGDPTVLKIYSDIMQVGDYNVQSAIWEGTDMFDLLYSQAELEEHMGYQRANMTIYEGTTQSSILSYKGDAALYEGKLKADQYRLQAVGTALSGASSAAGMYAKYAPSNTYAETVSTDPFNMSGGGYDIPTGVTVTRSPY